ncbi:beta-CASP ribonuclease aCPSF1 [Candidatus Woesearchaeota archaeon]|nr:beta-CASP ribonuclease aCPSF1 [Candidatus Woesearchaeota archaeon]MCF7900877.1 beta-CASP ribonuclease aCPSF1 [Candidatus Woesearchaeota archaeon]MCF8013892.1 beta-CASP ribonuclease aCPSF1 [Candidatus Woesearchaeota archaeon]
MPSDIIKEILKDIPEGKISDAVFEGANIVLYSKDKVFVKDDKGLVKSIVHKIKKRIELRPDPSLCHDPEKAEKEIRALIGEEANIDQIIFDEQRSIVIIEAEKPGLAIGKQGELLQKIKAKTFWVPQIKRKPLIRSQIIENIRSVLYQNSDYRRKFLHKVGERVYNGWLRQKKHEWIRISYLGGGRQVGRSCLLLQTPESRILLDCGIDVSNSDDPYPYLEAPELNIKEIDAVIVSHAHVDHTGLIPYLFKFGYRGPVYCTAPTRDIMALLQLDTIKIARGEGKDPIYDTDDVKEMVKHTITLDYEEVTDVTPDVRITLYNAGHTLGSAMVHIHVGNGLHNLLYTGDIKFVKTRLLSPAATQFPRLETMLVEGTYGGRENITENVRTQDNILQEVIKNTVERGGKVLMPTLGSGRGQEVLILVEEMVRSGLINDIPIYIDGMVWDITAIFTAYPEFLNSTIRQQIFHKDNNPFLNKNIKQVGSQKERKQIIEEEGSCIILATSGMLSGGPSVEYLKNMAEDKRHTLVFSCYQGEGTLGRRIQRGEKEIIMRENGREEVLKINMDVTRIEISGHADRRELMNFVSRLNPRPRRILVNHGESNRCLDLASSLHKQFRIETEVPRNLECVRIK